MSSVRRAMSSCVTLLITLVGLSTAVVATAGPAVAACPDAGRTSHRFTDVTSIYTPTNIRSEWVSARYGPISITRTVNKTATASASVTATVSAEAGIVFAKASASIGVTVGASFSWSGGWSYTMNAPKGPYRYRVVQKTMSRSFTVTKSRVYTNSSGGCAIQRVYRSRVYHAPVRNGNKIWMLQRQAL
jgi:hypothetical protein